MFDKSKQPNTHYTNSQYSEDHWSMVPTKEGTAFAFFTFRDQYRYVAKLNPTDSRGYRLLITYLGKVGDNISSSFNRDYTVEEQAGLFEVTSLIVTIYKKLGIPIVQCAQAGNNAHSFDKNFQTTEIGNDKEPNLLHMHLFGRGDPQREYISGIPLNGPELGFIFDMRGATVGIPGNCAKVKWKPENLQLALSVIQQALCNYCKSNDYNLNFDQILKVTIIPPPTASVTIPDAKNEDYKIQMLDVTNYPDDHWVFNPEKEGFCVAYFTVKAQYQYVIQLNRDDRRGNRLLVTYMGEKNQNIKTSFKRCYETAEQRGLFTIAALMQSIYKKMGFPLVQIMQHGNNSQAFDHASQAIILGNEREPNRLMLHVVGRGNPQQKYIANVELEGPLPGEIFDTRASTFNIPGNQEKIKWDTASQAKCIAEIRKALESYCLSDEFSREFSSSLTWHYPQQQQEEHFHALNKIGSIASATRDPSNAMQQTPKHHYNPKIIAGLVGIGLFAITVNYFTGAHSNNNPTPKI